MPQWMPLTLKIGAVLLFLFYKVVPLRNLNKYLDDTFPITGSDPILFASHGFVWHIMLQVFHCKEFCEIIGIQQKF